MNWSYIAGFFDGEGHISYPSDPQIMIYQSGDRGKRVLCEIAEFLLQHGIPSGFRSNPYMRRGETKLGHYIYITNRDNIVKFLRYVLPYIRVKRAEAQDAIRFFKMFPRRNKGHLFSVMLKERKQRWAARKSTVTGY